MAFEDKVENWFRQLFGAGDASASRHGATQDLARQLIEQNRQLLGYIKLLQTDVSILMMNVRDILDEVRKNSNLASSIVDALAKQREQIASLTKQKGLDAESQAILEQALSELQTTDTQMSAAAIANTPAAPTNLPDQQIKNDGPTEEQKNPGKDGLVPPTKGTDTSGVDGPGPDQEPKPADDSKK